MLKLSNAVNILFPKTHFTPKPAPARLKLKTSGMTLVEVVIAMGLLALLIPGVLGLIVFSRTITEKTIMQNTASAAIQGYIEQIKSMPISNLPYTIKGTNTLRGVNVSTPGVIPTTLNGIDPDTLRISTSINITNLSSINPTQTNQSGGVINNPKRIDVNKTPENENDDMLLNIRIWIRDISRENKTTSNVREITIHYAWRMGNPKGFVGRNATRTIISSKPSA